MRRPGTHPALVVRLRNAASATLLPIPGYLWGIHLSRNEQLEQVGPNVPERQDIPGNKRLQSAAVARWS